MNGQEALGRILAILDAWEPNVEDEEDNALRGMWESAAAEGYADARHVLTAKGRSLAGSRLMAERGRREERPGACIGCTLDAPKWGTSTESAARPARIHSVSVTTADGTRRTDMDPVTVHAGDRISVRIGEDKVASVIHDPMLGAEFTPEMAKRAAVALAEHERNEEARRGPTNRERLSRLTDEHMAALRQWAKRQGSTWRLKLRHAWECGTLTNHTSAADAELLQQVRDIIGPSGLAAVKP
jgi:hypothetical protein